MALFFWITGSLIVGTSLGFWLAVKCLEEAYKGLHEAATIEIKPQGQVHIKNKSVYDAWTKQQRKLAEDFPDIFGYCVPARKFGFKDTIVPDTLPEDL